MNFYIEKFTEMIVPACLAAMLTAVCFIIVRIVFKKKVKITRVILYVCMVVYLTVLLVTAIFERGWNPGDAPEINLVPLNDLMSKC